MFKAMLATDAYEDGTMRRGDVRRAASDWRVPPRWPMLASPKLDGVRATVRDGKVWSRSNKLIPNEYVQRKFYSYEGFDGELIVGKPNTQNTFQATMSGVMSRDGKPDVTFFVFDLIPNKEGIPYSARLDILRKKLGRAKASSLWPIVLLDQTLVKDQDALDTYEQRVVEQGYEGVMLRAPNSPYKQGRSTAHEGYLLKVKRFMDSEAVIVGFKEQRTNTNAATVNELGRSRRSSAKAGKVGKGTLGAFICKWKDASGKVWDLNVGTGDGLTDEHRQAAWDNRAALLGKTIKFKYQVCGTLDKPRMPVYIGFRNSIDLD